MEKIKVIVNALLARYQYSSVMKKTLELILNDKMNSLELRKCLSQENLTLDDIKIEALSLIIDYSRVILEDNIITSDEIRNITMLKLFYQIQEGEFFEFGKKEEVMDVLLHQLRKLYAYNSIDRNEAIMKTELQELFGLCYDDFLEINNIAAKEAMERGADLSKLDTILL